uniref:Uncharacterized protein n=1 Tax=Romanomermis culicivorax TaxID=13658 RepID=A0A915IBJ4_ROMCU
MYLDGNLSSVASCNDKSYILEPVSNFLFDDVNYRSEHRPLLFTNDSEAQEEDDASSYYFETESGEKDAIARQIIDNIGVDDHCRRQRSSAMLLASIFSSSGGSLSSTLSAASVLEEETHYVGDSFSSSSPPSNNSNDLSDAASLTTVDQLSQGGGVESSPSPPLKAQIPVCFTHQRKSRLAAKFSGFF